MSEQRPRVTLDHLFWILAGIPSAESSRPFEYYIIPSYDMSRNVLEAHELWLRTPGAKGQAHKDSKVRIVHLPPRRSLCGWDISSYLNNWSLIESKLKSIHGWADNAARDLKHVVLLAEGYFAHNKHQSAHTSHAELANRTHAALTNPRKGMYL